MKVNAAGADVAEFPPHFRHIDLNDIQGRFWPKKILLFFYGDVDANIFVTNNHDHLLQNGDENFTGAAVFFLVAPVKTFRLYRLHARCCEMIREELRKPSLPFYANLQNLHGHEYLRPDRQNPLIELQLKFVRPWQRLVRVSLWF